MKITASFIFSIILLIAGVDFLDASPRSRVLGCSSKCPCLCVVQEKVYFESGKIQYNPIRNSSINNFSTTTR